MWFGPVWGLCLHDLFLLYIIDINYCNSRHLRYILCTLCISYDFWYILYIQHCAQDFCQPHQMQKWKRSDSFEISNPSQEDGSFFLRAIGFLKLQVSTCAVWKLAKKTQQASLMVFLMVLGPSNATDSKARSVEGRHCSVWGNHRGAGRGGVKSSDLVVILVGMFLEGYPRCQEGE